MAKEGFLMERPILGAAGLQFIRRSPSSGRPTDRGGRKDIPGFRHQGCSPFRERSACGTTRSSSTTGSSHGASLARCPSLPTGLSRSSWAVWWSQPSSRLLPSALRSPCWERYAGCCVSWSSVSPFSNRSSKRWVRLSLALRCSRSSAFVGAPAADFPS